MAKVHMFDVTLAEKYGPVESVILSHLCYWIEKNAANQTNYHKNRYWTYNSITAFEKIFSYLNKDQIRRILDKLKDKGVLYVDNFNKIGYDRTLWYSVNDEVLKIYNSGKQYEPPEVKNVQPESQDTQINLPSIETPSAQTGINDQTGKWGENNEKNDETGEFEETKTISSEKCCPNGQMDLANSQNASAQTGIDDQMGKWDENSEKNNESGEFEHTETILSENHCPNGQMDVANSQNPSAQTGKCISHNCQIDLANSPDRSGEFAAPIPDINIYKPSDSSETEKEIKNDLFKKMFLAIDRSFVFSEDFYRTADAVLNKYGFGEDYCRWLYRTQCLNVKPRDDGKPFNIRGLYYTLFSKPEMLELYVSSGIKTRADAKEPDINCVVCGTLFQSSLSYCPACQMRTSDMNNTSEVEHYKHYLTLSVEQKNNYENDLSNVLKLLGSSEYEVRKLEIEERYGFVPTECEVTY